jgi:hypothetical protein
MGNVARKRAFRGYSRYGTHYGYSYRRYHYYQYDRFSKNRGTDEEAPEALEVREA